MGLNVVVGYAGLLDLGYVAFFATGAYLYALLASPASPAIDFPIDDFPWLFWTLLPAALFVGAFAGVMLGIPVLPPAATTSHCHPRLRRDYPPLPGQQGGLHRRLQGLYGIKAPLTRVPGLNLTELKSTA
jgi:hypothetical protein